MSFESTSFFFVAVIKNKATNILTVRFTYIFSEIYRWNYLEINLLNEFAKTKRLSILRNILKTNLNEFHISLEPVKMKFIWLGLLIFYKN